MTMQAVLAWMTVVFVALWLLAATLTASTSEVCIAGQVIELGSTASTTPAVCS